MIYATNTASMMCKIRYDMFMRSFSFDTTTHCWHYGSENGFLHIIDLIFECDGLCIICDW